ncbi:MAG: LOG family protein [Acidobacteriota bacterium]
MSLSTTPPTAIAVFGGSEPPPGSPEYRRALDIGRLLAGAGFTVINGGYGGVMEASARGAREAGGTSIGVTARAFPRRGAANPYIDREIRADDLFDRTRRLVETASAFIVLPGRSGTLSELAFLWALLRAGLLGPKPIVLVGTVWRDLLHQLARLRILGRTELDACRVVRTPREAVKAIALCLGAPPPL